MIVVDSSVLIAVVQAEQGYRLYEGMLAKEPLVLPASCLLEASVVARQRDLASKLDAYIARLAPRILPFDARQAAIAIEADRRYGRNTGHPARLNFGDCMSYAAAIALDAPLMFKGEDFTHTDVRRFEA
jgi:ribonuclease VapC